MTTPFTPDDARSHGESDFGAFALSKDAVYSGGADGTIHFRSISGVKEETDFEVDAEQPQTCLALLKTHRSKDLEVFVGSDDGSVHVLENKKLSLVVRTTPAPVLTLDTTANGKYLIMTAAESSIRVRDVTNRFQEVCAVELPSKAAFRGAAVDPSGEFLSAFDNENKLHFWKIDYDLGDFSAEHFSKRHINFDDTDRERPLFLSWDPAGQILAVPGGVTHSVHLYKRSDLVASSQSESNKLVSASDILSTDGMHGHKGDVVAVAWSPTGRYVASSCVGGVVIVWDVESLEAVKIFENSTGTGITKLQWVSKTGSNAICAMSAKGECIFLKEAVPTDSGLPLPSKDPKARVERTTKTKSSKQAPGKSTKSDANSQKSAITSDSLRKDRGNDRQGESGDDTDVATNDPIDSASEMEREESDATQVEAPATKDLSNTLKEPEGHAPKEPKLSASTTKDKRRLHRTMEKDGENASDEEDDALIAEPAVDHSTQRIDDLIAEDESDNAENDGDDEDDDDMMFDENVESEVAEDIEAPDGTTGAEHNLVSIAQATRPQDPFMPSSAPVGLKRRFLCWNSVGSIVARREETHNSIEIEFADIDKGRSQRFRDHHGFVIGALSESSAIFATFEEKGEEELEKEGVKNGESVLAYHERLNQRAEEGIAARPGRRSVVHCRAFHGYRGLSEWTLELPKGESAILVAAGSTFVACATTENLVRIFGTGGLQDAPIGIPGPVVALVASRNLLVVIYHGANPIGTTQLLRCQVLNTFTRSLVVDTPLPLSPGSVLTWVGFGQDDDLYTYDSLGNVSGLQSSYGYKFRRVAEHRRQWPVCINRGKMMAVGLRAGDTHPTPNPRPVTVGLPLSPPILRRHGSEEHDVAAAGAMLMTEFKIEALNARIRKKTSSGIDENEDEQMSRLREARMDATALLDKSLVKMMQSALSSEQVELAYDICRRLRLENSFTVATRIADHEGYSGVARYIDNLRVTKFAEDTEEEDASNSDDDDEDDDEDHDDDEEQDDETDKKGRNLGLSRRDTRVNSVTPVPVGGDVGSDSDEDIINSDDEKDKKGQRENMPPKMFGSHLQKRSRLVNDLKPNRKLFDEREPNKQPSTTSSSLQSSKAPANPFATSLRSPARRKRDRTAVDDIKSLAQSPSPKKPMLSRQSTFSAEARNKKHHGIPLR